MLGVERLKSWVNPDIKTFRKVSILRFAKDYQILQERLKHGIKS